MAPLARDDRAQASEGHPVTDGPRAIGRLLVIALPLYFTWEMLQAPAFTGMPDEWKRATAWCP